METRCHECDSPVGAEQAFCQKCGAVVGMADSDTRLDEGWNLEATMTGQKPPPKPRPSLTPAPATPGAAHAQAPRAPHAEAAPARAPRGGNTALFAVIGLVAVLLVGGLLLLLLYLNSRG